MTRFLRAQLSSQLLASVAIATLMLTLVASYAASQRELSVSQPSPVPLALRHAKADTDSDFRALFCGAGLCASSQHDGDATLSFSISAYSGLYLNLSNLTKSYSSVFNSSKNQIFAADLASQLGNGGILLSEAATGSNFSISGNSPVALNFNASSAKAYSLTLACANTTAITWAPPLGSNLDINWSISLPGYSQFSPLGLNRSLNYSASYSSACGQVNISVLQGSFYANFSYQNVSVNAAFPASGTVGVYALLNRTAISAPGSVFSSICASGSEPIYPPAVSNRKYGSFHIGATLTNFIIANLSGSFNATYFDTNGNCNFTDFSDEYFVSPGEWVNLAGRIAKLESIAFDGSGETLVFASAGAEGDLLKGRLVQPIYFNK